MMVPHRQASLFTLALVVGCGSPHGMPPGSTVVEPASHTVLAPFARGEVRRGTGDAQRVATSFDLTPPPGTPMPAGRGLPWRTGYLPLGESGFSCMGALAAGDRLSLSCRHVGGVAVEQVLGLTCADREGAWMHEVVLYSPESERADLRLVNDDHADYAADTTSYAVVFGCE